MPWKLWKKRSNFVLEKSGKPQSDFCTNPVNGPEIRACFLLLFGISAVW